MRPEEKEWWRRKQHDDYERAKNSFVDQQRQRDREKFSKSGGSGCILIIFLPFAALAMMTAAKCFVL